MSDPKDSIEITPEMKAAHQKIHDAIGAPELTIAGYAKGAFAALAGSSDPLGISSALVDDLQARIAGLKEELKYAVADGQHAVACLAAVANQRNELIEAMKGLYKADTMLRLHVMQAAPKVKAFSSWEAHTEALRVAERALRAALMGGGGLGKGENASPKEATDNDEAHQQGGGKAS